MVNCIAFVIIHIRLGHGRDSNWASIRLLLQEHEF